VVTAVRKGTHSGRDGARYREAVAIANVPTLLPVLVQLSGDTGWLEDPYRPIRSTGIDENATGGLPEAVQTEIRAAALEALLAWRAGAPVAMPDPSDEMLVRMLSVSMGEEVSPEYGPMMAWELGLERASDDEEAPTAPVWFDVLVIGAGASGIAAAVKLEAAGIPYTIVEQADTVGGTWLENRYPGAGVDTPSALYSFSFAQHDWSKYFALRDELHDYLEGVADEFGVRERIRLQTKVVDATYDEVAQRWTVRVQGGGGGLETLRPKVVISAVGAFRPPKMPSIPGLESFPGPCVHTARWPTGLELAGRRVAVIGNGASGMQLLPAIVEEAATVTVFQRSPQWAAPFEALHQEVPEPLRFLSREVPLYRIWYRLRWAWIFNDRLHPALQKDASWAHPERSLNKVNDRHREFMTRYIRSEIGERPDLLDAVVPDYPPFGKRMLLDNGWYRSLTRADVELVTEPIAEVRGDRVVTESGVEHEVDVIACATGFDVVRFLSSFEVRGPSGRTLREAWDDDDARAYLGTAVPGFPNLFMLYGPNTQAGHGGSLLSLTESQLRYVIDLLGQMIERGIGAAVCREEVYDEYNRRVDEAHERMVWTHPGMSTYYRNSRGRVVVNTPFRIVDFWHMTREADLDDYVVEPAVEMVAASR
jgi:4-hydroxyacetophenone monooxygenase